MKILEGRDPVTRTHDAEADILNLSIGADRAALGIDIDDGIVLRYDEQAREVVGVTIVGLQSRVQKELADQG